MTIRNDMRSDQVGSLRRPDRLLPLIGQKTSGAITAEEFDAQVDVMIAEEIAREIEIGMDVVTDGEFRRLFYGGGVVGAIGGIKPGTYGDIGGKLSKRQRFVAPHEIAVMKQAAPGRFKTTMPTPIRIRPEMAKKLFPNATPQIEAPAPYKDFDEVQSDFIDFYVDELEQQVAEGVPYIQFDNVITPYVDREYIELMKAGGQSPEQELAKEIAHMNRAYAPAKGKAVRAMHFCRGNRGKTAEHFGEGAYEPIAEQLFGTLEIDRFLMEFDTDRAGGFAPLRFVRPGQVVVLGLVTTKSESLEDADYLVRRIEEASKFVDVSQLAISPQCGFSSGAMTPHMSEDEQWAKLARVVEVARKVWG